MKTGATFLPPGPTVLRAADRSPAPWRNGGGSTSEILLRRHPAEPGAFDWRLSIARVAEDGPFSRFPGVDRALMALDPGGLHLDEEGATVALAQYGVHCFPGENAVASTGVTVETLDLNLMWRRDRRRGTLTEHQVSGLETVSTGTAELAIVLLSGWLSCRDGTGPWIPLAIHDAVLPAPGTRLQLIGRGRVALARVLPR